MRRRAFLAGLGAPILGASLAAGPLFASSPSLRLSGYPYDRIQGLMNGNIEVEGFEHSFETDSIGGLNTDALGGSMTREVTEIGLVPYIIAYSNEGLRNHTLIPVFPLRTFRHKSIYIRPDRGIERPEDLVGKTIASPGYSSTSLTWIRGIVEDEYGVSPSDINWVVSAGDSAGAATGGASGFENFIPDGVNISTGPEGLDESELLVEGIVDALFHAAEPKAYIEGNPLCVRLFDDSRAIEQAYFAKTSIYPIMHAVAIRRDFVEAHPEVIAAVFNAYSQAKNQLYAFQRKEAWYISTVPWISQELEQTRAIMGHNFHSYGMTDANQETLKALLRYCHDQGLSQELLSIEDLFHPSSLHLIEEM
ncbi:ABC transporter substrate-binding protein [Ruegeria sp. AD91A]|uniref:ABC transporter substrate-binding protein n=1 Tax=Ruegeria sp. AD91A TaxID=2293862 RepID=UPI000E5009A0|nr:ABC transporter substrate-binding protein [Ruegeria sp. AD91A]AXT27667.1 ABC transporter substrate-binding protein [Ruegeria sp. AD91A]